MKTFILSLLGLGTGFGVGYFVGHIVTKKKYRKIADDEVESVKTSITSYYEEKYKGYIKPEFKADDKKDSNSLPKEEKKNPTRVKPNVPVIDKDSIDYKALKDKQQYEKSVSGYLKAADVPEENTQKEVKPEEKKYGAEPYVISPEEFADGEYDVVTLNYYIKDKILADDDYNIVKDIKGTVGKEALNSFGIENADAVYVRNDTHGIDYEILFNNEAYNNVAPKGSRNTYPGDDE